MTCSYIVAIDNTYALISNFLQQLLCHVKESDEIILIDDACNIFDTLVFLDNMANKYKQIRLIHLKQKAGFGKANNIGISIANGDTIIFINTDIFLESKCIDRMLDLLWSSQKIGAVQPLLVYPQTNKVQSTGHVFSDYRSGQLFSMRKIQDIVLQQNGIRQALTMALCAVKSNVIEEIGGFDEYYYNSHEGLELSLKITLNGYNCYFCSNAIAYHCSGGARKTALNDISKQKAHFYHKWYNSIQSDLVKYLSSQLKLEYQGSNYFILDFSTSNKWKFILKQLNIHTVQHQKFQERFLKNINLFYCLPYSTLNYGGNFLFLCDNMSQLSGNYKWILLREQYKDIIMDLDGNLVPLNYLIY